MSVQGITKTILTTQLAAALAADDPKASPFRFGPNTTLLIHQIVELIYPPHFKRAWVDQPNGTSVAVDSVDVKQVIYALERQAAALDYQSNKLAAQQDYSAEFPAADAECMREAIQLLSAPKPRIHVSALPPNWKSFGAPPCYVPEAHYGNYANEFPNQVGFIIAMADGSPVMSLDDSNHGETQIIALIVE